MKQVNLKNHLYKNSDACHMKKNKLKNGAYLQPFKINLKVVICKI